jgi:uncharacterized membrane protein
MKKMKFRLIPHDEIIYESTFSTDELIDKINNLIEYKNTFFLFLQSSDSKPFLGVINKNKFEVNQIINDRKSLPIAIGEINPIGSKTIINIKFRMEFISMVTWIGFSSLLLIFYIVVAISSIENLIKLYIIPLIISLLWLITNVIFNKHVKKMKTTFKDIFNAKINKQSF